MYCVSSSFQPCKGIGYCMFVCVVLWLMVIQHSVKESMFSKFILHDLVNSAKCCLIFVVNISILRALTECTDALTFSLTLASERKRN